MPVFNCSEHGHVAILDYPHDMTGGSACDIFSMREWSHVSIIFAIGATAGAMTNLVIEQCTDKTGAGNTAIAYNYHACETTGAAANCDVLGVRTAIANTGIVLSETDNIFYTVELDADELSDGYEWVKVSVTCAAAANFGCIIAVFSGARYAGEGSRTVFDN